MTSAAYADMYAAKLKSADVAVTEIGDGETIAPSMAIGQPPTLLSAVAARLRANDLKRIRLYYKGTSKNSVVL